MTPTVDTAPTTATTTATTIGVDRTIDHIVSRVADADLSTEPCLNLYLSDAFPDDVYRRIVASLPADEALDFLDHPDAYAAEAARRASCSA